MSGIQRQTASSGSENDPRYANVDERKRKRMISNRESARRSRMRKQKQLENLVNEVNNLKSQSSQLRQRIDQTSQRYASMVSSNNVLRSKVIELTERLHSLNSMLRLFDGVSGFDLEIPEIPDPLLKPLQVPFLVQSITASRKEVDMY